MWVLTPKSTSEYIFLTLYLQICPFILIEILQNVFEKEFFETASFRFLKLHFIFLRFKNEEFLKNEV